MGQSRVNEVPATAGEVWKKSAARKSGRPLIPADPTVHHIVVTTLEPISADSGDWHCLVMLDTWRDESPARAERGTGKRARFRIQSDYGWERVS